MEIEKNVTSSEIFIQHSQEPPVPEYQKITFELPWEIGERFLTICDTTNKDPDAVVARLIKRWITEVR